MKIGFKNKTRSCYKEIYHQVRYTQETCETVVPDINDDIGKIASIQSSVYLKSKDITGRGVLVSGEVTASLVYVTESEKAVSFVKVSKQFSIEFDVPADDSDFIPQIKLDIQNTEARIINPRKLSITFEIFSELSCYKLHDLPVETLTDSASVGKIHAKINRSEIYYINAVREKTFTLSEQLVFPTGKPAPSQIAMLKVFFDLNESQNVGSKLIIKGTMNVSACYLSDEVNYPVKLDFSTPFSQIVDVGVDEMDGYVTMAETSSVYYEIINTISGEKALDLEIHALLQINAEQKGEVKYISDVYSNVMPADCDFSSQNYINLSSVQHIKLISDERISVVDDCTDVLSVFSGISHFNIQPEKISACLNLDIVYRTKGGNISAVRRTMALTSDCIHVPERLISAVLKDLYIRPDGAYIDVHAAVDIKYRSSKSVDIRCVSSVELDEDNPYDFASFPALHLVRTETEDLWELAKKYHSNVKKIIASNSFDDGVSGKLLLIPKSI